MGTPYAVSSDLVSAYPAKSLAIAQYIDGYKLDTGPVQNAQTGTSYTFALTDTTKTVTASNAAASAYTIPPQSSVVWEAYTVLRLVNLGAGVVTLTAGAGVTLTGTVTVPQYGSVTIMRTASNAWTISGTSDAPGMVLITPTSVAGSGVTLSGGQVTFSAALTVSINGCFTSAYANYLVVLHQSARSASGNTLVRMRAAGSDTATTTYPQAEVRFGRPSFIVDGNGVTGTAFPVGYGATGNTEYRIMHFLNAAISAQVAFDCSTFATDAGNLGYRTSGICTQATAHDGFTYYPSLGNVTGTLRVYGLRNS